MKMRERSEGQMRTKYGPCDRGIRLEESRQDQLREGRELRL